MPMSTITVAGISPTLKILGATQQFNYAQEISLFQLTNSFIPTDLIGSKLNYEFRNNLFSGFRWTHLTENTDTYGSLTLQSFINAQTFGDDILKFNNSGISIFAPVDFNNNILTSGTWNGNTINVSYGGTGITTTTPYSVICGGITATGALQSVANLGLSGQVLTSQGAGALPIWANKAYCNVLLSLATNTTITTANTYYKINGITSSSLSNLFSTSVSNRMTYTGTISTVVLVNVSLDCLLSGGATLLSFSVFKNGIAVSGFCSPISETSGNTQSISLNCLMPMQTNNFIEVFTTCGANNRTLTVTDLNFTAIQVT